jgi:hypothetical protein
MQDTVRPDFQTLFEAASGLYLVLTLRTLLAKVQELFTGRFGADSFNPAA